MLGLATALHWHLLSVAPPGSYTLKTLVDICIVSTNQVQLGLHCQHMHTARRVRTLFEHHVACFVLAARHGLTPRLFDQLGACARRRQGDEGSWLGPLPASQSGPPGECNLRAATRDGRLGAELWPLVRY